jgi:hypothetical protein
MPIFRQDIAIIGAAYCTAKKGQRGAPLGK